MWLVMGRRNPKPARRMTWGCGEPSADVWSTKLMMNNTKASEPDVSVSNDTKVRRVQRRRKVHQTRSRRFERHEGAASPTRFERHEGTAIHLQVERHRGARRLEWQSAASPRLTSRMMMERRTQPPMCQRRRVEHNVTAFGQILIAQDFF